MKFLTIADWTGVVETELLPALQILRPEHRPLSRSGNHPTVEPFENGRGFTLRVLRAGKPRAQSGRPARNP